MKSEFSSLSHPRQLATSELKSSVGRQNLRSVISAQFSPNSSNVLNANILKGHMFGHWQLRQQKIIKFRPGLDTLGDLSSILGKDLREYCRNESGQERHSAEAPEIYFDLHLPKSITTTSWCSSCHIWEDVVHLVVLLLDWLC